MAVRLGLLTLREGREPGSSYSTYRVSCCIPLLITTNFLRTLLLIMHHALSSSGRSVFTVNFSQNNLMAISYQRY